MIDKEHIETKKATVMSIPEQNLQINSYFYERYPDGSQDDPDKKSRPLLSDPQLNEIRNTIAELDDLVEELNVQRIKRKVTEFQSRFVDNWIKIHLILIFILLYGSARRNLSRQSEDLAAFRSVKKHLTTWECSLGSRPYFKYCIRLKNEIVR